MIYRHHLSFIRQPSTDKDIVGKNIAEYKLFGADGDRETWIKPLIAFDLEVEVLTLATDTSDIRHLGSDYRNPFFTCFKQE